MFNKKRGQITLFIIIGIIILLGVMVILYIRSSQEKKIEIPTEKLISAEIPGWAEPIKQYVDGCIQEIAVKGFKEIGWHGGYIDLNDDWLSGRSFSIDNNPTESDAVLLSQQGLPIIYWWYLKSPNNCQDCEVTSLMPTLTEIEEQMNKYIDWKLQECLNDFEVFKQQGFQFEAALPTTTASIEENDVDIFVDYPIEIIKGESKTSIPAFNIKLDLRLREIFELAFLTTLNQINNQTQEDILMHLIGVYSGVSGPDKLPPIGWLDHKSTTQTWNIDDVKENLMRGVLGSHIASIQIDKTRDAKHITVQDDPLTQGLYDVLYLDFLTSNYPALAVNFLYDPSWERYFDITPKSGKTLAPITTSQNFLLNLLPTKRTNFYQFFYDISYPVVVTIRDDQSLTKYGEKGYTFMFALEVNIRDNKDLLLWNMGQGTIGEVNYDQISVSFNLANGTGGNCTKAGSRWSCSLDNQLYATQLLCMQNCIQQTTQIITDAQQQTAQSLFCNYNQRISKNITVNVFDQQNNPLKDAVISFACGNYRICNIGSTDSNGQYIGRFPFCFGDGYLRAEKESYLTKVEPKVSIDLDKEKEFNIILEPLQEREIEVVYINVTNLYRAKGLIMSESYSINSLINAIEGAVKNIIGTISLPNRLTPQEANIILSDITTAKNKLTNAQNLINDIENYYEANRSNVVRAAKLTKEATSLAYNFVYNLYNQPNFIDNLIGRDFKGNINIGNDVLVNLYNSLTKLNKWLDNVQFLEGSEVVNSANIQKYRNQAIGLKPTEKVTISIGKIKENQYEQNIGTPVVLVEYNEPVNISLAPGKYNVEITSQDEVGYIIPGENLKPNIPTNIPGYGTIQIETPEDMVYPYVGSAKLDDSNGNWIITEDQLRNSNKVRFYLFKLDRADNIEDLGEASKIEEYSKRYRAYIEPQFLP